MNCQEFEQRLQLLLDERDLPGQDEKLLDHSARCADCRDMLAAEEALFAVLPQTRPQASAEWSQNIAQRVVAAAKQDSGQIGAALPNHSTPGRNNIAWLAAGLLSSAVVLTLIAVPAWQFITGQPAQSVAVNHQPSGPGIAPEGSNHQQPTVPPELLFPPPPSPDLDLIEYQVAVQHWMEHVELAQIEELSPGIRPLRASLGLAFDTLRRAFPGYWDSRSRAPAGASLVPVDGNWS